jgi:hypothetical protein
LRLDEKSGPASRCVGAWSNARRTTIEPTESKALFTLSKRMLEAADLVLSVRATSHRHLDQATHK